MKKTKKELKMKTSPNKNNVNGQNNPIDELKKEQSKELIRMIESSYQNIYFTRCKSYRKTKIADLDFEFDFSTFDSHDPYYPSALQDINSKLSRTNGFWKDVGNS